MNTARTRARTRALRSSTGGRPRDGAAELIPPGAVRRSPPSVRLVGEGHRDAKAPGAATLPSGTYSACPHGERDGVRDAAPRTGFSCRRHRRRQGPGEALHHLLDRHPTGVICRPHEPERRACCPTDHNGSADPPAFLLYTRARGGHAGDGLIHATPWTAVMRTTAGCAQHELPRPCGGTRDPPSIDARCR